MKLYCFTKICYILEKTNGASLDESNPDRVYSVQLLDYLSGIENTYRGKYVLCLLGETC